MKTYHQSVLVNEVLEALNIQKDGTYLDVTFGGGGHSKELLDSNQTISVIGFDWDQHAIEHAESLQEQYGDRLALIWGSFAHLYRLAKKHKIKLVDGILADFGTSQFQIHERDGFSVYNDTALDMRMSSSHFKTTAADIINYATEKELCEIFWEYGEERNAKKIVQRICQERQKKKITTTKQLASIIEKLVGRSGKIHPATRVFQALRIFVNKELDNITAFLPAAFDLLKPGGRLVCISFHSLEDRLVKTFYREKIESGKAIMVEKKALQPTEEERAENPASRSAKLRVIEKK